jgi:hypothetical protein
MLVLLSVAMLPFHDAMARYCDEYIHPVYPPLPEALDALVSDDAVTVTQVTVGEWTSPDNFYYKFVPNGITPTIGFIIYPGACVDPGAYAPAAHAIAAEGYLTVIVKMVEDIAFFSYTRAQKVINDHPGIEEWTIGGHSLGGTSACAYIYADPYGGNPAKDIDGVVLWAAYPASDNSLANKIIKSLSIYGTKDGLVTADEIEISRLNLPPYTQWGEITGGNHTQFGYYWDGINENFLQPDDNPADITREEQQNITIQNTVAFLNYIEFCSNDPENDYDNDGFCGDVDNCPLIANGDQVDTDHDCIGDVCDPLPNIYDPSVSDSDGDGIGNVCDNCPANANGGQQDSYPPLGNNCGNACECEGDFNGDGKVDGTDAANFKKDFGRGGLSNPCSNAVPCKGDFTCDKNVSGTDAALFKSDFGRNALNNPCPSCLTNPWCTYP